MPEQERYQGESQFSSSLVVSEWLSPSVSSSSLSRPLETINDQAVRNQEMTEKEKEEEK